MPAERREFVGKVKYSGAIGIGTIPWKSGSLIFTLTEKGWKLDLMNHCSPIPMASVKLDGGSVQNMKCRNMFMYSATIDGHLTSMSYKPTGRTEIINTNTLRDLREFINLIRNYTVTPVSKCEVGLGLGHLKTLTPRGNNSATHTTPGSVEGKTTGKLELMRENSPMFTSMKENKRHDRVPFMFDVNILPSEERKENVLLNTSDKDEGSKVHPKSAEKSATRFYSSPSPKSDFFSERNKASVNRRTPGLISNPTPIKRPRLSDHISYTMKNKSIPVADQNKTQALQGFSNLGNTCYMNSILQSLFALDMFASDLQETYKKLRSSLSYQTLYYALWKLLSVRKQSVADSVRREYLRQVKTAISSSAKRFSGYGQHDAHEFLGQVLDQLKEEVIKVGSQTPSPKGADENILSQAINTPTINTPTINTPTINTPTINNPTISSFEFEVQHTISCQDCLEEMNKTEQFLDVSLDLPRRRDVMTPSSLQDAVNMYFHNETIDYTCEKCRCQKAEAAHRFSKLPRVLILHLKRYSYNQAGSQHTKRGSGVSIPLYVSLQDQCTQETRPPFPSVMPATWSSSISCTSPEVEEKQDDTSRRKLVYDKHRFTFKKTDSQVTEDAGKNGQSTQSQQDDQGTQTKRDDQDTHTQKDDQGTQTQRDDQEINLLPQEDDDEEFARAIELSLKELKDKDEYSGKYGDASDSDFQRALELSLQDDPWTHMNEDKENERVTTEESGTKTFEKLNKTTTQEERENKRPLQEKPVLTDPQAVDVFDLTTDHEEPEQFEVDLPHISNEKGELPYSYRLVSIVSHIGSSSSTGHYVCDVYDMKKRAWYSYDDSHVSKTTETEVRASREHSGYIFFYVEKSTFEDICDNLAISATKLK